MGINWLEALPKVELHLHLEGAIPLDALWVLIEKYGGRRDVSSLAALEERFAFRDFEHFIQTWVWKNSFLREYEDFTFISERIAEHLKSQNIRYVEAFYSPGDFVRHGLTPQGLTGAIRQGLERHTPQIRVNLIADLIRDFGPEKGDRWLSELLEVRDLGLIGIGIGGSEQHFPPEVYRPVFERAQKFGLHSTAHAGEVAGSSSIWGAIKALKVDRIGHGTRAFEDERLIEYLIETQLPVEMCPISNVRTGVVATVASHPIRSFFEKGMLVSVNTDDPAMFHTSLVAEYQALVDELGFTPEEIKQLVKNGIHSAWCDEDTKSVLLDEVTKAALPIAAHDR